MFTSMIVKRQSLSRVVFFICLIVSLVAPISAANAQETIDLGIDDPYQFPVLPGSPTWQAFTTHQEMLDATRIPDEVVESMSTVALIRTAMDYPLLFDMYLYNSTQQGFDAVTAQFQALQVLKSREDVTSQAISEYLAFPALVKSEELIAEQISKGQDADRFAQSKRLTFLETLLAQDSVLNRMTAEERQTLFSAASNRLAEAQANSKVLGPAAQESPLWLIGKILYMENPDFAGRVQENATLRGFLESGSNANDRILDEIQGEARSASNDATEESGSLTALGIQPYDYSVTSVRTPKGSVVPGTIQRTWELSSTDIAGWADWVKTRYSCAALLRSASRKYNCHSYAWYNQSTSNTIWMNDPGDDKYWQDGSYQFSKRFQYVCVGPNAAANGSRVSYEKGDHSAIYYTNGWMQSKWGQGPVMQHGSACAPYNSDSLAFYVR